MTALLIIIGVILFILLLRFGVTVDYGEKGFRVRVRIGCFFIKVYPVKKEKKPEIKKIKKEKKKPSISIKPGNFEELKKLLTPIFKALSRIKKRLLIKTLIIHFTAAGSDPMKTALTFGAANASLGLIIPPLEKNFRIRKRDIKINADFNLLIAKIYLKLTITIAVWEVLYIAFALLPILFINNTKKGNQNNGETSYE